MRRGRRPLVSVVVAVQGRAGFLDTCLRSAFGSTHRRVEVLVVAEPGNRHAAAAVRSSAVLPARRARVIDQGWLDAAVAAARGRYLAFADADDVVPDRAYADLVGLLERSGSDLAVGFDGSAEARVGADLGSCPEVLSRLALTDKLFRLDVWRECGRSVPTWHGASATVGAALLGAASFDVWPAPVYDPHARDVSLPIDEQSRFSTEVAAERLAGLREVAAAVRLHGVETYHGWLGRVLADQVPPWCVDAVGGGQPYFALLAPLVRDLLADLPDDRMATVPVHPRMLTWAAAHGTLEDVALVQDLVADNPNGLPTTRARSALLARLPDGLSVDLPERVRRIEPVDRVFRSRVDGVLREADGRLVVEGATFTEYDDPAGPPALALVSPAGGAPLPLVADPRTDPRLNLWAERGWEDRSTSGFTASVAPGRLPPSPTGRWRVAVDAHPEHVHDVALGNARVVEAGGGPVLKTARLEAGPTLVVTTAALSGRLRLVGGRGETGWCPVDRGEVRIPLQTRLFGAEVLLPTGRYRVETDDGATVRWAADFVRAHVDLVGDRLRVTPADGPHGAVAGIGAPLQPEERSAYDQQRLVTSVYSAVATSSYERTVLLETFRGRSVGDSPGAVGRELLDRDLDLDLAWVVDDPSVAVPEGTRAVPRRSEAWHVVLARARAYVGNAGAPYWFAKKPDQVHLQTWHGTPLKRIGEDRGPGDFRTWRHRRRIAAQAAGWDAMISPSPFCSEVFRTAFRFAGDFLEVGYPRNDVLLDTGRSGDVRRSVRDVLGVADGEHAVLYAPTWREYVGVRDTKPLYLDAELLTRLLPDTVVLVRGHYNSTTQADVFAGHPRIHDVTRFPDIADLYLAADALVTDYSSVMFDFALTDKPQVLMVPDLDQYRDVERGFYLDLDEHAPGPMVTTTEAVAAALTSADGHAAARTAMRERFCPWDDGRASARAVDWLLERL